MKECFGWLGFELHLPGDGSEDYSIDLPDPLGYGSHSKLEMQLFKVTKVGYRLVPNRKISRHSRHDVMLY